MDVAEIQAALAASGLDGWLFYDFRGSDPLAYKILGLPADRMVTRRWFYFLPATGEPTKIVHRIETDSLDGLPGKSHVYLAWGELETALAQTLAGVTRVAMQYSPRNAIPYISRVDAGTIEQVRSLGVEVVPSGDLVQRFEAVLTDDAWESHTMAAGKLATQVLATFREIGDRLRAGVPTTEYDIQQFMEVFFQRERMIHEGGPIVAVGANAANPHYGPTESHSSLIRRRDLVLVDTWGKLDRPGSIYADITWMGYVGERVPDEYRKAFQVVREARDKAVEAIQDAIASGTPIRGCDVDDVCRGHITAAGMGEYFVHRTGHSIHQMDHGNGANIDNLETRDERRLIPRTLFSIEPGVYFPGRFGIRSEINVFIADENTVVVSGRQPQHDIFPIPLD